MLFNSIPFLLFLPVVFLLYWFVFGKSLRWQNIFVIAASYVFYGWWDWRFLGLIVISSAADYLVGLGFAKHDGKVARRWLLTASLVVNLGILGFFKYFDFFVSSFIDAMNKMGLEASAYTLGILLPVGISFYTFQTLSYTIDVYRKRIEPTRDPIAFFAFVSFFPQLVAGPIERAKSLLPQFLKEREFSQTKAVDGLRQIVWGFFKKIVIADTAGIVVDAVFANIKTEPGSMLLLGAVFFGIQIYADFSGYSDIAIGTARLFGFKLMTNFKYPYFARDIGEFWRRWHISLSTWFRDYVYIPLGGNRGGPLRRLRNVFITFVVSGLWHGANWTFVTWGALHALYFLPFFLADKHRKYMDTAAMTRIFPSLGEICSIFITFTGVTLAWVFFRAADISEALLYFKRMFNGSLFDAVSLSSLGDTFPAYPYMFVGAIVIMFVAEWIKRTDAHPLHFTEESTISRSSRWVVYIFLITVIAFFAALHTSTPFIYFQF